MSDHKDDLREFAEMLKSMPVDAAGADLRGLSNYAMRRMSLPQLANISGGNLSRRLRTWDGRRMDVGTLE
jgi:hypothetical protein